METQMNKLNQLIPGIGRALTELITTGSYQSIDISNMAVERVFGKQARHEPYVLYI